MAAPINALGARSAQRERGSAEGGPYTTWKAQDGKPRAMSEDINLGRAANFKDGRDGD